MRDQTNSRLLKKIKFSQIIVNLQYMDTFINDVFVYQTIIEQGGHITYSTCMEYI